MDEAQKKSDVTQAAGYALCIQRYQVQFAPDPVAPSQLQLEDLLKQAGDNYQHGNYIDALSLLTEVLKRSEKRPRVTCEALLIRANMEHDLGDLEKSEGTVLEAQDLSRQYPYLLPLFQDKLFELLAVLQVSLFKKREEKQEFKKPKKKVTFSKTEEINPHNLQTTNDQWLDLVKKIEDGIVIKFKKIRKLIYKAIHFPLAEKNLELVAARFNFLNKLTDGSWRKRSKNDRVK